VTAQEHLLHAPSEWTPHVGQPQVLSSTFSFPLGTNLSIEGNNAMWLDENASHNMKYIMNKQITLLSRLQY